MNGFIRKMCILKELKKGFSADGSPLGGVARVETFAGQVTLQISLINFAPLSDGRYVCVLCDKGGERIVFPLSPGVNEYHVHNLAFNVERGFCCLVCFLFRDNAECLAGGQFGGGSYSMKLLLSGLRAEPPVKNVPPMSNNVPPMPEMKTPDQNNDQGEAPPDFSAPNKDKREKTVIFETKREDYDDEKISDKNYYAESGIADSFTENGDAESKITQEQAAGRTTENDEDAETEESGDLFARSDGQSYYLSVKDELERLFASGRRNETLEKVLPNSEWVEVKDSHGCLVGQVYEQLQVRYIAYALPAREKTLPEGMEKACYIPTDPVHPRKGYYVLFQSAATGECVEVRRS